MLIERSALTFSPVVIRIEALALAAVRYTSRAPTAIASVPVTAAVVVFVVALPVTLVRSCMQKENHKWSDCDFFV